MKTALPIFLRWILFQDSTPCSIIQIGIGTKNSHNSVFPVVLFPCSKSHTSVWVKVTGMLKIELLHRAIKLVFLLVKTLCHLLPASEHQVDCESSWNSSSRQTESLRAEEWVSGVGFGDWFMTVGIIIWMAWKEDFLLRQFYSFSKWLQTHNVS